MRTFKCHSVAHVWKTIDGGTSIELSVCDLRLKKHVTIMWIMHTIKSDCSVNKALWRHLALQNIEMTQSDLLLFWAGSCRGGWVLLRTAHTIFPFYPSTTVFTASCDHTSPTTDPLLLTSRSSLLLFFTAELLPQQRAALENNSKCNNINN